MLFRDSTQVSHLVQLIPFAVPRIHACWIMDVREDIPAQPFLHLYVSWPLDMLNLSPLTPMAASPRTSSPEAALFDLL